MKSTKHLLVIAFASICAVTFAQQGSVEDSTTLYIQTNYEPILKDAVKMKENPSIKDTNKLTPKLTYDFLNKQIPVVFDIDPIKAAKIKGEPLVKLYRGYAKLGFGTNTTPLAEVYYNAKRSRDFGYGFHGKHFSSSGISGNDYSGFSENSLGLFGKRFLREFTLVGKADYNRSVNHYYGFPEESSPVITNADDIRQDIDKISGQFSLTRNFTDTSQFDYNVNLGYHYMSDIHDAKENHFELDGNLSKYHKRELYSIGAVVNYNKLTNTLNQDKNLVIGLNPHISTNADKWQFQVGIGLYLNSYPENKFHFYPKAEFKYNIVDDIFIPYVGITGGIKSNNLNSLYNENPFVNTKTLFIQNSNEKYNIYGGIRGSFSSKVTFNTSFSRQKVEGMPLYVKDYSNVIANQFTLNYDTVTFSKITTELAYQNLEKIKFILKGDYISYTVENEIEAWHRPNLKVSLSGIYDLGDKIVVKTDLFFIGKQYAKELEITTTSNVITTTEKSVELDGVFDANLSLEYRYTKKLSAFINFNNIASQAYEKWQDYPTQKFQVLGGLTYSF